MPVAKRGRPTKPPRNTYSTPGPGRVRCLGPRAVEHYFANGGLPGVRVCPRCRDDQTKMRLSKTCEAPHQGPE